MPFRRLPDTDVTRATALAALTSAADSIPTAEHPISAAMLTQAGTHASTFTAETGQAAGALQDQILEVGEKDAAGLALGLLVSHFFQVFDFAIERGALPASARTFHQRDAANPIVPLTNSDALLRLWAHRIVDGEAARAVGAGSDFVTMAMPSAAEVGTALGIFEAELGQATDAKLTADDEAEDVAALRAPVDFFIRDAWDTIEFYYRHDAPPSLRRKARIWGVTYAYRPDETPDPETPTSPAPPTP